MRPITAQHGQAFHLLNIADEELRNIKTNERFVFEVRKGDKDYNQKHYEALGEVNSLNGNAGCCNSTSPVLVNYQTALLL